MKQIETPKYGYVTVKDVMIETDDTNLESGVEILDEMDFPICEVVGYSSDELIENPNLIDELIECYC